MAWKTPITFQNGFQLTRVVQVGRRSFSNCNYACICTPFQSSLCHWIMNCVLKKRISSYHLKNWSSTAWLLSAIYFSSRLITTQRTTADDKYSECFFKNLSAVFHCPLFILFVYMTYWRLKLHTKFNENMFFNSDGYVAPEWFIQWRIYSMHLMSCADGTCNKQHNFPTKKIKNILEVERQISLSLLHLQAIWYLASIVNHA